MSWLISQAMIKDYANSRYLQGIGGTNRGQSPKEKESRTMANARCELGGERNTTRLATNSQEWSASTIHTESIGEGFSASENVGDTKSTRFKTCNMGQGQVQSWGTSIGSARWWGAEPNVDRVVNGLAFRVERLKAIGNGQVPLCAATAFELLRARFRSNASKS